MQPGSLYMIYDSFTHLLDVSIRNTGTTGFLEYMRSNMTAVLQSGHNPNLWLTHYDFPDRLTIPPINKYNLPSYLKMVGDAAERYGGRCVHTVSMADMLFCYTHDIIPLTPDSERTRLCEHQEYGSPMQGYGTNMPRSNVELPEYRAYQALETETGVMLFSYSPEGQRQREQYEHYHELNFFNVAQINKHLRYHEIICNPLSVREKVDCLSKYVIESNDFSHAYADREILSQGYFRKEFNLTQNDENYRVFCRRNQEGAKQVKHLMDYSLADIFKLFTSPLYAQKHSNEMECVGFRKFPGEDGEMNYRRKI